MKPSPLICVPGQRLCLIDKQHVSGQGTYERGGYIYATLAGVVDVVEKNGIQVKLFLVMKLMMILVEI